VKRARVIVLVIAAMAVQVPPVLAESLLQSATRLAQQAARELPTTPARRGEVARATTAAQDAQADSGTGRRKKFWIVAAGLVAAAAGMYAIDRGVEDNTPSTKGTRKD
jgi:hypothetical protein